MWDPTLHLVAMIHQSPPIWDSPAGFLCLSRPGQLLSRSLLQNDPRFGSVWYSLPKFSYACVQGPHRRAAVTLESDTKFQMVSSGLIPGTLRMRKGPFGKILLKLGR